jgi:hypothetical protein
MLNSAWVLDVTLQHSIPGHPMHLISLTVVVVSDKIPPEGPTRSPASPHVPHFAQGDLFRPPAPLVLAAACSRWSSPGSSLPRAPTGLHQGARRRPGCPPHRPKSSADVSPELLARPCATTPLQGPPTATASTCGRPTSMASHASSQPPTPLLPGRAARNRPPARHACRPSASGRLPAAGRVDRPPTAAAGTCGPAAAQLPRPHLLCLVEEQGAGRPHSGRRTARVAALGLGAAPTARRGGRGSLGSVPSLESTAVGSCLPGGYVGPWPAKWCCKGFGERS